MRPRLILLLVYFAIALLGTSGMAAAQPLAAQSSSAAGVTVKAMPRALSGGAWEFEIVFDTHTQALSDDLMSTASLRADSKLLAPAGWQGDPSGDHHRKGVLKFNASAPQPHVVELIINRPGEPKPRSFRWQLQ
jgi:hypothetical protein